MKSPLSLTIHGAAGRMGHELVTAAQTDPELTIVSLWEHPDHPARGQSPYGLGVPITAPFASAPGDVVIDFTLPVGLASLVAQWQGDAALVSGTTGLGSDHLAALDRLAEERAVFYAPNMSVGIHLLKMLARQAARLVGESWDVELVEMHHNRKVDAPSGTALALVEAVQEGWPRPLRPCYGRSGETGARKPDEMGVFALRGGGVVGVHELVLAGPAETLRLRHSAQTRALFAHGALEAARWLATQRPGRYGMDDLLGRGE